LFPVALSLNLWYDASKAGVALIVRAEFQRILQQASLKGRNWASDAHRAHE